MATECAPRIRVNAIAVGSTATSALDMVLTDDGLRTAARQIEIVVGIADIIRMSGDFDLAVGACAQDADEFVQFVDPDIAAIIVFERTTNPITASDNRKYQSLK